LTSFTLDLPHTHIVFGSGSLQLLGRELDGLGVRRVMVISTGGRAALAASVDELIGSLIVHRFESAVPHVPERVVEKARAAAGASAADSLLSLGGGSAIGIAKAVALQAEIPIAAVPTTYSGSEMTPIWGLTASGEKKTGRDVLVQPRLVLYDPALTLDLPPRVSASSGLNAVAHCIEALYAVDGNPLTSSAAERGISLLSHALRAITTNPREMTARSAALTGACLAGFALGTVQMALHHKLCHTLGGTFDMPHADTHAVLLPYTAAFNASAAPEAMRAAAVALGARAAPAALLKLARDIAAPMSLAELGMREADIDRAVDVAVSRPYPNPRPVTRDALRELLNAALVGDPDYIQ